MKICVISSTVFPIPVDGYSGLEHLVWLIGKGLAEKGHAVSVIAPDSSSCPGCEIIPMGPSRGVSEAMAYERYWKLLPDFDAIIDHSWQKYSYLLKKEGRLKSPVLGVLHAPVNTMLSSPPPVGKPCIVCLSNDQKNHYEALFSGQAARVAYNGVDASHYRPLPVRRTNRFLFLARFSSIKGPDLAIAACKRVGVGLDLIGDTSITNESDYYRQCTAAADGKQIRIVGPCSRGASVWWMSRAHAFLHLNQRFREPLGLAPLESQLCGTPVIAWRYGAMTETVEDGVTGTLVNSLDKACEAVATFAQGVSEHTRERCREYASAFSVQRMVDTYERLCREAIDTGGW